MPRPKNTPEQAAEAKKRNAAYYARYYLLHKEEIKAKSHANYHNKKSATQTI